MDQYHGQGGSYLLDPDTGERTLVERTETAAADPVVAPPPEPAPSPEHRRRARSERGRFRGDDPATPDVNEAWQ